MIKIIMQSVYFLLFSDMAFAFRSTCGNDCSREFQKLTGGSSLIGLIVLVGIVLLFAVAYVSQLPPSEKINEDNPHHGLGKMFLYGFGLLFALIVFLLSNM